METMNQSSSKKRAKNYHTLSLNHAVRIADRDFTLDVENRMIVSQILNMISAKEKCVLKMKANGYEYAEIAVAIKENLRFAGVDAMLVSHGSSTVPSYIVEKINALGGKLTNTSGIPMTELLSVIPDGICKINVDTDIRLAVTRNLWEYFTQRPDKQNSPVLAPVWELLKTNPEKFDPRIFLPPVMDSLIVQTNIKDPDLIDLVKLTKAGVKEVVGACIVQFGSIGHADDVAIRTLDQMANFYQKELQL